MEQKAKVSILAILVVVIIAGDAYIMLKNRDKEQPAKISSNVQIAEPGKIAVVPNQNPDPVQNPSEAASLAAKSGTTQEISGKVRSINEKAVYIELADGKGFAASIDPSIPVLTEGVAKPGTLVDLKIGQSVIVKADNTGKTIQILIKK